MRRALSLALLLLVALGILTPLAQAQLRHPPYFAPTPRVEGTVYYNLADYLVMLRIVQAGLVAAAYYNVTYMELLEAKCMVTDQGLTYAAFLEVQTGSGAFLMATVLSPLARFAHLSIREPMSFYIADPRVNADAKPEPDRALLEVAGAIGVIINATVDALYTLMEMELTGNQSGQEQIPTLGPGAGLNASSVAQALQEALTDPAAYARINLTLHTLEVPVDDVELYDLEGNPVLIGDELIRLASPCKTMTIGAIPVLPLIRERGIPVTQVLAPQDPWLLGLIALMGTGQVREPESVLGDYNIPLGDPYETTLAGALLHVLLVQPLAGIVEVEPYRYLAPVYMQAPVVTGVLTPLAPSQAAALLATLLSLTAPGSPGAPGAGLEPPPANLTLINFTIRGGSEQEAREALELARRMLENGQLSQEEFNRLLQEFKDRFGYDPYQQPVNPGTGGTGGGGAGSLFQEPAGEVELDLASLLRDLGQYYSQPSPAPGGGQQRAPQLPGWTPRISLPGAGNLGGAPLVLLLAALLGGAYMAYQSREELLDTIRAITGKPPSGLEPDSLAEWCYTAALRGLAWRGLPKMPWETPREYLSRVRPHLEPHEAQALERLTLLYELAIYAMERPRRSEILEACNPLLPSPSNLALSILGKWRNKTIRE